MDAPKDFADWLTAHKYVDPLYGWVYRYHSRSDAHSVAICQLVLRDIVQTCQTLRDHALADRVIYGINARHTFPNGKTKTLDLAIGTPETVEGDRFAGAILTGNIDRVLISCEAKTCMTEHSKSQPRIFDELGSSHEIVHQGDREAIACGITVVNIADTFVSPLRQRNKKKLHISQHKQPHVAQRMINHLRGLPIRDSVDGIGFDAYATLVVDCDNQGPVFLWIDPPAPQPGERDHYDTFVQRIAEAYTSRFGHGG